MERCPTCQARWRGEPICGRCRTDLSVALAAEAQATAKLRAAIAHLAGSDGKAARDALEESLRLKRGPLALSLRNFLARTPEGGGSEAGRDRTGTSPWP